MATSMTGYGKSTCQINGKAFNIEIKALNSKSLDLFLKMPQIVREKENQIRNLLSEKLIRGKIEFIVTYENTDVQSGLSINKALFKQYYKAIKSIADELDVNVGEAVINTVMKMPDVVTSSTEDFGSAQWEIFENCINEAIANLIEFRKSEGEHLKKDINNNIQSIKNLLDEIPKHEGERIDQLKLKMTSALSSIAEKGQLDTNRFEQELIYYFEKLDINEEKVRLGKHLQYFTETIKTEESSGKKLGFISQEIGREINTIGSKAQHAEMQKIVVQMKDELEKIKEQLMNLI
ncbi:MAG: YicC family protein [Bacteroidetes bacterium]|nr:YicC family protein [Bacteroidota bacterium]